MSDDILVKIPDDELPELRDFYKDFKLAPHVYSTLNTSIRWKKNFTPNEEHYLTYYAPNGDWKSDGTFILLMQVSFILCFFT